ncbi:MAG: anaerobic ribonucleoside-triphosphate reductase activating protein [Clostridia bacterium]|nr:anaerobic ribonucleoside-triphosphate reductase activating protein [Clostridia bacterium]
MLIGGLQKLTLLDFPGHVACTIFTHGCNFRCPFCHNSLLVNKKPEELMEAQEVLDFLKGRTSILDGVAITGGEPLLHKDIGDFISKIKDMGYQVKLDTNGSYFESLENLVKAGLVDYVAMDVKNSEARYGETAGNHFIYPEVEKSIDLLLEGRVPYEFRTTAVKELHTVEDFSQIGQRIQGADKYFIQCFKDSGNILKPGLSAPTKEQLNQFLKAAREYVPNTELRGV